MFLMHYDVMCVIIPPSFVRISSDTLVRCTIHTLNFRVVYANVVLCPNRVWPDIVLFAIGQVRNFRSYKSIFDFFITSNWID